MHKVAVDPSTLSVFRKYFDQALNLKCFTDLIDLNLFPNAKEITESFAAYDAVRKHLKKDLPLSDDKTVCVVVGDGNTPRTGATFAFRSAWDVHSVDPRMKKNWVTEDKVKRLSCFDRMIEDFPFFTNQKLLIVAVHAHVRLPTILNSLHSQVVRHVVAIPCCVKMELDRPPDIQYDDLGVLSPMNTVKIWKNV